MSTKTEPQSRGGEASRALIYVRQSVAREDSISLELQEKACRDHARTRGYAIVDVIADPGVSGLQFSRRPGIQAS